MCICIYVYIYDCTSTHLADVVCADGVQQLHHGRVAVPPAVGQNHRCTACQTDAARQTQTDRRRQTDTVNHQIQSVTDN